MDEYESVLLVKPEVFVYKIPPRATSRGYRASDWKLESPDWTGKLQVITKGKKCVIKLLDKNTGELFAKCPIDTYPGNALETVGDSSRYFVLRIESDDGQTAFIGIGFADRGDSFDMNVALQDHFKWLEKSEELEKSTGSDKPALDLGFKDGQTITINMNITKKPGSSSKPRPKGFPTGSGTPGLLPPPPSGIRLPPPKFQAPLTAANPVQQPLQNQGAAGGLLLDLGMDGASAAPQTSVQQTSELANSDLWSEFSTASTGSSSSSANQSETVKNWMDF